LSTDSVKPGDDLSDAVTALLVDLPIKAASFIVTIYGDVVEPRGGVIWIGNLIETCKSVGITETLVRTAVSRLVTAGQLVGEREGRRSFYRLTDAAQGEFVEAASLFYGPKPAVRWQFVLINGPAPEEIMQGLERDGFARLNPRLAVGTHPAPPLPGRVVVFDAQLATDNGALREFAEEAWNLSRFAEAYEEFVGRFGSFSLDVADCAALSPFDCLIARLLLVHQYRLIVLREPHLPQSALPDNWPGEAARRLFADLYLLLSKKADGYVGRRFVNDVGRLQEATAASRARLDRLVSR